jgi:hypothetical protein
MALLRIDIAGNPKTIPYRTFGQVAYDSIAILDDLDVALSERNGGSTEWFMNDLSTNGGLRLEIYSKPKEVRRKPLPDVGGSVARHFVTGFSRIEHEGKSPAYLTDRGMHRAQHLAHLIGERGPQAIIASVPEAQTNNVVEITRRSADNLEKLIPAAYKALGSVEGYLETISIHRNNRFVVYQGLTGKAVSCHFPKLDLMDKIKNSLGARVQVSGLLSRNEKGEPVKVLLQQPSDLKVFGPDLKVLPFKQLGGSDPDFTGNLSTEDFIKAIRG